MSRRDLREPLDPEKFFREIERQIQDLAKETRANNPNVSLEELAEKILAVWRSRPDSTDKINLLFVKPALCFTVGFRGEEKKIFVEL